MSRKAAAITNAKVNLTCICVPAAEFSCALGTLEDEINCILQKQLKRQIFL